MLKKFQLLFLFLLFSSVGLFAQQVMLTDEFDNGDSKWSSGWIDAGSTTVTTSIDNTGKLSGANSYKLVITKGSADTWRVQRNADLPLQAGYEYTVSFMAVASKNASINVLFEIAGDPYTKRLNETPQVTTTAQTFTYKMVPEADVPTNQLKLHFGGTSNDGATIWVDKIVVTRRADPSLVTQWGNTPRGTNWPILNTANTAAGSASMGAAAAPTDWASIRGTFPTLTPTTDKAVVVTGTLEFVGGGSGTGAYTWLRYALMGDDNPTLNNQNTTTAAWAPGTNGGGYGWMPHVGTADVANGTGGGTGASGTLWLIKNNNWNSSNTNAGGPLGPIVREAPLRATATAGVYNWAISVKKLADGSFEIKYYLEKQHAANVMTTYWFGGTVIDPAPFRTSFNYIAFSVNKDVEPGLKQVNLANVKATLGDPITIPDAPFQPIYVNQWGSTPRGNNWPILNDANSIDGDAAMGADKAPTAWASIRGGFGQDVTPTLKKAIVVSGQMEFVGGGAGNAYTWLRYALIYDEGAVLTDQNKPTAAWTAGANAKAYQFTPRSGVGELANGAGGSGVVWTVTNAAWNSTYSNAGGPLVTVQQAPSRAVATAGVYNWAISVQPLADGTNEIRWYIEKQHAANVQATYWLGGSCIDKTPIATKFNAVAFSVNNDVDATCKQFKVTNVKVDLADPITVPDAPWQPYYLTSFSAINGNNGGWTYTTGDMDGNYNISGTAAAVNGAQLSAALSYAISPKTDKAVLVSGKMELVGGGFEQYNSLGIGLTYNSGAASTDASQTGYVFFPHSDNNPLQPWGLKDMATVGAVVERPWLATSGNGPLDTGNKNYTLAQTLQQPAGAIGTAGIYTYKFSIGKNTAGNNEVRYLISKSDGKYNFGGVITDTKGLVTKFNTVNFYVNNPSTRALKITDLMVDMGAPITIPAQFTKVVGIAEENVPVQYSLNQNYPNPFNPTTNIEFSVAQAGKVSLVVYDGLGRTVANLVNGDLSAGKHNVTFNASNLASGVYFYKLIAGDFVSVKKLMLVK